MRRVAFALLVLGLAGAPCLAADEKAADGKYQGTFAAYSRDDNNTQHVFYRNNEGNIIEMWAKYGDTAGWSAKDLTQAAGAPKAASTPVAYFVKDNNTQHVIYRGDDGNLTELFYNDSQKKWEHVNLTAKTGAPKAAGTPTGYRTDNDSAQHVVYRSTDGDVIELFNATTKDSKGWGFKNLTGETKAPKAEGNPYGYFLKYNNTQHVVYRDQSGDVNELFHLEKAERWGHTSLMAQGKFPKAASDPVGYVVMNDNTQHVIYRTDGGEIIELYHVPKGTSTGWHSNNLTGAAKATKAAGRPFGYFVNDNRTQHVVFRDTEGNVQEMYLKEGQDRWAFNNLSALTKAPKAASDPAGYYLDKNDTQHIVFRTTDGEICELYHRAKGDQQGWFLNNLTAAIKPRQ